VDIKTLTRPGSIRWGHATTTVPAPDALGIGSHTSATGNLSLGYYSNDLVASETQGSDSVTFGLDPLQNRVTTTVDGSTTTTNHYVDGNDSPAWTSTSASAWSRNLAGPAGQVGTIDQTGAVTLQLANMHGDAVATVADDASTAGVVSYCEFGEFGAPRNAATAPDNYGWLGQSRRSGNDLGGMTLMGVRLYNSATGRFLSVDPMPGAGDNAYEYCRQSPIDCVDLSGEYPKNLGPRQISVCSVRFNCLMVARGVGVAKGVANQMNSWYDADIADAFQHVVWITYVTYHSSLTEGLAIGFAHERDTHQPNNNKDELRDIDNDILGASIGYNYRHQRWSAVLYQIYLAFYQGYFHCIRTYHCRP